MAQASRRRVLQALGSVLGASAVTQVCGASNAFDVAEAWLPRADTASGGGRVFAADQLAVLGEICRQTIPQTSSPGAYELDVHGFIDNQLYHCYPAGDGQAAVELVRAVDLAASERTGKTFVDAGAEPQLAVLQDLEKARGGFSADQRSAFKHLKNLLVFGYLTTEAGAKACLAYDPFPGGFKGSIPLDSTARAWLGNVR